MSSPDRPIVYSTADVPMDPHAAYGVDVASVINTLLGLLGHEVDVHALTSVAAAAALASLGDKAAVLKAIVAHADAIFPDALTRPLVLGVLDSLLTAAK